MDNNRIADLLLSSKLSFEEGKSFKSLTSFKTGGSADFAVYPKDEEQAISAKKLAEENDIPFLILGKGSNVLAPDEGFKGIVMVMNENFGKISLKNCEIEAQSGASLACLCKFAKENNLTGLEFAYGIPGSVGGAVIMNAGAYGGEMCDVIKSVTCADENGKIITLPQSRCEFAYRKSIFQRNNYIILSARFSLLQGDEKKIEEKMEEILNRRREKQPLNFPSAGSTFKRPEGYFAAALIDECGLKGMSVGDACVSEKHAGFVINMGNATSNDVKELCERIKRKVYEQKGVELEMEIKVL